MRSSYCNWYKFFKRNGFKKKTEALTTILGGAEFRNFEDSGQIFWYNGFVFDKNWAKLALKDSFWRNNDIMLGSQIMIIKSDSWDYTWDFEEWEKAYIIWFKEPFINWETDHIVRVSNWKKEVSLKTSKIQLI